MKKLFLNKRTCNPCNVIDSLYLIRNHLLIQLILMKFNTYVNFKFFYTVILGIPYINYILVFKMNTTFYITN